MQKTIHTLFIITLVYCFSLSGMENTVLIYANTLQLPKEIIAQIAGYCLPKEKNLLMRLCNFFCVCLKDRELILRANPSTVSWKDKHEDMFVYTYADNIEMMKLLLKNGINVNYKNFLGMTFFHVASDNGSTRAMQLLVDHGADVNVIKPKIQPLHEATWKGDEEMVKTLLRLKVDPNVIFKHDITPLHIASSQDHITIIESLLYAGAKINQATDLGHTPLYTASSYGHANSVKLLLYAKAKVNHAANNGWTPLHTASLNDHIEVVALLLYAGAQVNQVDSAGRSPLFFAQQCIDNIELIHVLINAGADVNRVSNLGWTPLSFASFYGNIEAVKLLVHHGANISKAINTGDPNFGIKKGDTALHIARKRGHADIAVFLEERIRYELIELLQKDEIVIKNKPKKKTEKCIVQ